jgi:hypothetical protein
MNKTRQLIRHGEVVLIPLKDGTGIRFGEMLEEAIIAHSESGHHHVVVGTVEKAAEYDISTIRKRLTKELYGDALIDNLFRVGNGAVLEHRKSFDQHKTIPLEAGIYVIVKQQDYDYFSKLRRQVED